MVIIERIGIKIVRVGKNLMVLFFGFKYDFFWFYREELF